MCSLVPQLLEYEKTLEVEGIHIDSVNIQIDGKHLVFLQHVLLPLLDQDGNGTITRSELRQLQLTGGCLRGKTNACWC